VHAPFWHVSVREQASPSLQAVPSATAGLLHAPVAGSHVPAAWHGSEAVHVTGFDPVQVPAWQVSVREHALPSLQAVPSATTGLLHAPVAGSQVPAEWHGSEAVHVTGLEPTQAPA
jgi:hypothetical protein